MKPEHINMARDAIAGRTSGDSKYYRSGDPYLRTGFNEAINTEYIIRSLDHNCGWEAALNENARLQEENNALYRKIERLQKQLNDELSISISAHGDAR